MMKLLHKALTVVLTAAILTTAVSPAAYAAAPTVTVDEAVYVNLDYYGRTSKVNVVKGLSPNGNTTFTDFGSYSQVSNMTSEAKPKLQGDSVTWALPSGAGRFYYEATPKSGQVTLPWSFDVSYKLNGVPTDAKKLAGASGLVEIDIKATPNQSAPDYYKNNMLLEVGTYIKMKDTLSIEAPGAQTQSLGDYKVVLFAGLPGQEKDYTIRIGTKKFESDGVIMMMEPGTMDQLKNIKDLKKDKDTWKSSFDSISTSADQLLTSLAGLSGGLQQTQSGLSSLNGARGTISSGKGKVYQNADQALAGLTDITKNMTTLVPHMQKGQQLVKDVNTDLNTLTGTIGDLSPRLAALSGDLSNIHSTVSDLRNDLDDADDLSEKRQRTQTELNDEIKKAKTDMAALNPGLNALSKNSNDFNTNRQTLADDLAPIIKYFEEHPNSDMQDAIKNVAIQNFENQYPGFSQLSPEQQAALLSSPAVQQAISDGITQSSTKTGIYATAANASLSDLMNSLNSLVSGLSALSGQSDDLFDTANDLNDTIEAYMGVLDDANDHADKLLKYANQTGTDLQSMLDSTQAMIGSIQALNSTMNRYKDGTVSALKDTENLTNSLSGGLTSTHSFLASLETLMKTSGDQLDAGTQKSLSGLIQILQKGLDSMGDIDTTKNANNTLRNSVDGEIDKIENESNLLNMDYEAKPISFTSSKNASPSSVQIVLRTQEISLDSNNDSIKDSETEDQKASPMARIGNIFAQLWKAITSIFHH